MERPAVQQHPSEMSPEALLCTREGLGLSMTELATVLGLEAREAADSPALTRSRRQPRRLDAKTVKRWERGRPISEANAAAFAALIDYTDAAVRSLVEARRSGERIVTYLDDESFRAAEPGVWRSLPASWHRAVARRAAEQTGASIDGPKPS